MFARASRNSDSMAARGGPAAPAVPWAWALLGGFVGALLAALVFAPASWLAWSVGQAVGHKVQLEDARGTVWRGSARLTLSGGPGSLETTTLPGRIGWNAQLNGSGFQIAFQADCCMDKPWQWQLAPRMGGALLTMAATTSSWPAELLAGLGTPWNTLRAQGQLSFSSQGLVLSWVSGRLQLSGNAQLDALGLSSRLSTLRPMGSYRLMLQGGSNPSLLLSTLSGGLQLSGRGQWVGARLRFTGEAHAADGFESVLSNLLNIIGRRQGARSIIQVG